MSFSGWETDPTKRSARFTASVFVEDVNEPRWAVKGPAVPSVFKRRRRLQAESLQHSQCDSTYVYVYALDTNPT